MHSSARQQRVGISQTHARLIGKFVGEPDGPTLIAVGSIHGNEPSGRIALQRVSSFLEASGVTINGRVYFLTGNVAAASRQLRFIDADLNRRWTRGHILRNSVSRSAEDEVSEDREQRELLSTLREILRTAGDEVYALDLHSTSADGVPFATVGDTMRNRRFALKFPVTILLGIEEQLEGTLLEFLNNEGVVTLGFEAGQHDAGATIANHEALVLCALVHAGIVTASELREYPVHLERLRKVTGKSGFIEVRHREPVSPDDDFIMDPGYRNFARIRKGQNLARNKRGPIVAPEDGLILMPLYQKLGEDGFFVARRVAPIWLKVSALLRRLGAARLVTLLPGVRQYPKNPEQLQVDTRIARFFPLQIFHLLGFRRLRWKKHFLLVSRRRFDTESPFVKSKRNGR